MINQIMVPIYIDKSMSVCYNLLLCLLVVVVRQAECNVWYNVVNPLSQKATLSRLVINLIDNVYCAVVFHEVCFKSVKAQIKYGMLPWIWKESHRGQQHHTVIKQCHAANVKDNGNISGHSANRYFERLSTFGFSEMF